MQFRFFAAAPSTTANAVKPKVDAENQIIYGVTAMQSGVEALGYGCMSDDITLDLMLALAKAQTKPIRQRFGHPGISENATGKQVAQASNFRIANGNLLHDSRLLDSARKSPAFAQDPIEFILDIAENNPSEFGESVVIDADLAWRLKDGREIPRWPKRDEEGRIEEDADIVRDARTYRPVTATTPLPVLRPTKFYYVDYVSEGALTHEGLFPEGMNRLFSTGVNAYAEELFSLVDNWIESYGIPLSELPKKTDQLLQAYVNARSKDNEFMKRNRSFAAASAQKYEDTGTEVPAEEIVPTEPQGEEADPLDGLEVMAAQIGTPVLEEMQFDPGIVDSLQAEQAELRAMLSTLASRFDRVVALLQSNLEATATIQRNVTRLSGEPVVTQRVPKTAKPAMEQLAPQFAHPAPNGATQMLFARGGGKPTMLPATDEFEDLEPAQAAIMRREKLQRQTVFDMEKTGGRSQ